MATTAGNDETLKQQFLQIQEQQKNKLQRRKELKAKKEKTVVKDTTEKHDTAFGVNDNLELQLSEPPSKDATYSEELVLHLNEQIREMKDETGRLYKLLSERDLEVRQLRKKKKEEAAAGLDSGVVAGEAAATKIVELSKKVRELTAEVEAERTKSKQLTKKCHDLHNQLQQGAGDKSARSNKLTDNDDNKVDLAQELKTTQDKLRQSETKQAEFRNQCASLKQEIKVAHKVLSNEVGEGVNIQSLLNSNSTWRGRQQQILALQSKVADLKSQLGQAKTGSQIGSMSSLGLDSELEAELMGSVSTRRSTIDDRHRDVLRRLEKDRKESQEKAAAELKSLEEDHASMKTKWDATKARNKVLAGEVKSLKQQLQTLLEKGRHDDELIEALMKQQSQLKEMLENATKMHKTQEESHDFKLKELGLSTQHNNNIVEQLKAIAAEKEAKVKALEDEIKQMKHMTGHKANGWFTSQDSDPAVQQLRDLAEQDRPLSGRSDYSRPTSGRSDLSSYTPIVEVLDERQSQRSASRQSVLSDRPLSGRSSKQPSARHNYREWEDLKMQVREFQGLYQATAVERDKLSELVSLLQSRLDESTIAVSETQSELQTQKRQNVQLEKQIGKSKVEQSQAKSGKKGKSKPDTEIGLEPSSTTEELTTSLAIQKDENAALKAALTSTLKAKEEDLKLYQQIMQQTREVFLQGLRQHKMEDAVRGRAT